MKGDINDTLRTEGAEGVRVRHDGARKFNGKTDDQSAYDKRSPTIFSKYDFLKGFVPPDYLIDGILQRRFIYALTGQTGHAKTALALLIAQAVSSTSLTRLGTLEVERGRVLYLVGENPDDIRMRVIGGDAQREDDPTNDRISFIPGVFSISKMRGVIATEARKLGGVDLVIVDTSAAYFLGQDENANPQMGAHARMLRTLTTLPSGPCVLVLCHPIKHVGDPSQLLPRGGGAFLAEMDGNLTIWRRNDDLVELHHCGKFRGPGFEPMTFRLEKITTTNLTDKKGRLLPTVRAVLISESEEKKQVEHTRSDEDALLAALLKEPDRSVADLARACNWTSPNGEPYKSKVHRLLERLSKVRPKLVAKVRDQWALTDAGKKAARDAALAREGRP
jgi:hypothetical protein